MLRNGWLFPNIPDADADAQQQYKLIFMDIYIFKNIAIQVKKNRSYLLYNMNFPARWTYYLRF